MPYVEYDEVEAVCALCGRQFRSEEDLEAHRREAHGAEVTAAERPPKHAVRCSVCHRSFPSVAALAEHNRRAHTA